MELSFSDDLLCCEENSAYLLSEFDYPSGIDESVAELIEEERNFVPGLDYVQRFQSHSLDASARQEIVAWILKVQSYYNFQPLTAYLSVNYLDRFLYARSLPERNGWSLQLLSIACLSLAAKMEEPLVPSLLDLQIEGAKLVFEPRTVERMELIVLGVLNWRLRSITPLDFLSCFAYKQDPTGTYTRFLISKATEIILSNIQEANLLEYLPSCIAAASILSAAQTIPNNLSLVSPAKAESWCQGLIKEKINSCYQLIKRGISKPPKVLPKFRVIARPWVSFGSGDSSSSSSSSSSSPLSSSSSSMSSSTKRRKLNNKLWVDDEEDKPKSD